MNLRQAAQQALEALIPLANAASPNERECLTDEDHERAAEALEALCAALAEPQTTHWEGCEAVHPECRKTEQEPDGISWLKRDSGYFTAPTPSKPLTDEELRGCFTRTNTAEPLAEGWPGLERFARAIERAHGIGEQT